MVMDRDDEEDRPKYPPYNIDPKYLEGDRVYPGGDYDERIDLENLGSSAAGNIAWDTKGPTSWAPKYEALIALIDLGDAPESIGNATVMPSKKNMELWLYETAGGYVVIVGDAVGGVHWESFKSMGDAFRYAQRLEDL